MNSKLTATLQLKLAPEQLSGLLLPEHRLTNAAAPGYLNTCQILGYLPSDIQIHVNI